ncbi:glutathione S-transferase family protein [Pseudoalteromonas aurantia]|uniref:Glutathione S-transferase n=1 Tax=Pseudoalteromonas aurantia 208 TaxID=1314867 RepID=A0ABR9EGX1_9GAMM|nr:glutathione S-transferase family protein [Pseudoalteromonas aurantia]MBE0369649.1 glutathione S-transferase [Pseudoalteromonas aurantia 208]
MYTLYYSQGACSVATHVVLRELGQAVKLIDVSQLDNFTDVNPVATVPVLMDGDCSLTEGAAIMLHILSKHQNMLFPQGNKQLAIQDIMFANATMHPAYGRLFFLAQNIDDAKVKQQTLNRAAKCISQLWQIVEHRLAEQDFLGGEHPSAADIMLAVYARWGDYFPIEITIGEKTTTMLSRVQAMPSFILADEAEAATLKN